MRRLERPTRGRRGSSRKQQPRRFGLERIERMLTWHRDAPTWQRRLAMTTAAVSVVVVLIGATNWLIKADIPGRIAASVHEATVRTTLALGFAVQEVYVADRKETAQPELLRALGTRIGDPILYFDAEAARDRLLQIGWIEDARVERRLPARIVVILKERQPIAIWQHQKKFLLVDRSGAVIGPKEAGQYPNLKIIIGNEAPKHAAELLAMLERDPGMMNRVTHATWVSGRQWNIRIENAIDVKLPADNPEAAWQKLLDMERDYQVLQRDITTVDLRIPEKTTVRVNGKPETIANPDNQT
jgi:cell division protein FtsQ